MEGDKHGLVKEPPPWSARLLPGTSASYLRVAPRAGGGRAQHAHEPAPPLPVGTGSSPSTPPGRRGVEPLTRARVLPDLALPPPARDRAR